MVRRMVALVTVLCISLPVMGSNFVVLKSRRVLPRTVAYTETASLASPRHLTGI